MKRFFLIVIASFSLIFTAGAQTFNSSSDLKNDLKKLADHGVILQDNSGGQSKKLELNDLKQDFDLLKGIAGINLKRYKFTKIIDGDFTVSKWHSDKNKVRTIYEVVLAAPVDTLVDGNNIGEGGLKEKIKIKGIFGYTAYCTIMKGKPEKLTYITKKYQGLSGYTIDKKEVSVVYEDIVIEPAGLYLKLEAGIKKLIPRWEL